LAFASVETEPCLTVKIETQLFKLIKTMDEANSKSLKVQKRAESQMGNKLEGEVKCLQDGTKISVSRLGSPLQENKRSSSKKEAQEKKLNAAMAVQIEATEKWQTEGMALLDVGFQLYYREYTIIN
jgi:hypothetical protein